MMKYLLMVVLVILINPVSIFSQTIISGNVTGSWTASGSPYIVNGDVFVIDSLIIEPGVAVQFQAGGWHIEAGSGAKFYAVGTENNPVIFEPYQGQFPGSWEGIRLVESGYDDTLGHCIIRYAIKGIYAYNCTPVVSACEIYGNLEDGVNYDCKVGTYTDTLRSCRIYDNSGSGVAVGGYDRYGAVSATIIIEHCLIYNNQENGVIIWSGTYWAVGNAYAIAKIVNCTISNNGTGVRAYAYRGYADATMTNCIIAFNGFGVVNQDSRSFIGAEDIIYNCIWENSSGDFSAISLPSGFGSNGNYQNANGDSCDINFNIYYDPLFVDTANADFSLLAGSKCIDAGTPVILGQYVLDPDGTLPDIGAYYHDQTVGIEADVIEFPAEFRLHQNYPNPFNPVTRISFSLPRASEVKIKIYNTLGQEVAVLLNERKEAGTHKVDFDGSNLSSGLYFYKIQAGSFQQVRKMLLVK